MRYRRMAYGERTWCLRGSKMGFLFNIDDPELIHGRLLHSVK